ncbi:MAG: hypothetical protein LUQ59_12335, partial [Methanothrix sp.]|nr:hypothetical protein [Methanothrix sp.]
MSKYTCVLIDTLSIQNYVFASNKLKENIGASFLVESIYKHSHVKTKPLQDPQGYIGGGNALLFFENEANAKEFATEWTTVLLVEYPGIKTSITIGEIEFDNDDDIKFKVGKDKLFEQLAVNKNKYHPQVNLPSHGLTGDCPRTGFSMEDWLYIYDEDKKIIPYESGYVSSISKAKIEAAKKAEENLHHDSDYDSIFKDGFKFTDELEKLGSSRGEDSHLAIVHIDGNNMGQRFELCDSLKKTVDLSKSLEKATKTSYLDLLLFIIENYNIIRDETSLEDKILPIRLIILGGDDITFVCDGRLGIYFAEKFLKIFEEKEVSDGNKLTACAGVAITKLKFPFSRGYQLAEELCRNAKMQKEKIADNGSWIDFHISFGGFTGSLEDIRKTYIAPQGNLLMRPYKIIDDDSIYSFGSLVKNTKHFFKKDKETGKPKFPNSKIKE